MTDQANAAQPGFRKPEIVSVLLIGVFGGFAPALQPLLLGKMAVEAKVTLAQIGQAAMLEALGMALAASLAGALLKPERLRAITIAAATVALVANLLTAQLAGPMVLLARFIAGAAAGVLLWLWIGLPARVAVPARLVAAYVTLQGGMLFLISTFFSASLLSWGGAAAGYGVIAGFYVVTLALVPLIPARYAPLGGGGALGMPDARGLAALSGVVRYFAGVMAFWVYVMPLGKEAGLSDNVVGIAISAALGSQLVAGLTAGVFASRLSSTLALVGSALASLAGLMLISMAHAPVPFIAGVVIIAFFWMFAAPFCMPFLIIADPSHRASIQMATATLLGVSVGPAIASFVVSESVRPALPLSAGFYILSLVIVVAMSRSRAPVPKVA